MPVHLRVEGLPEGTHITFTLTCHLELRNFLADALGGPGQAPTVLGQDGPWQEDFRFQAGLDPRQGRAPFSFHLPVEPESTLDSLPVAVFHLTYGIQAPGMPAFRQTIQPIRVDPRHRSEPLVLQFLGRGQRPDGSPKVGVILAPLGLPLSSRLNP